LCDPDMRIWAVPMMNNPQTYLTYILVGLATTIVVTFALIVYVMKNKKPNKN
jgi:uncharacterized membrane protein YuzA (DUF378 family)